MSVLTNISALRNPLGGSAIPKVYLNLYGVMAMTLKKVAILALSATVLISVDAQAAPTCAPRDQFITNLDRNYQETQTSFGLTLRGNLLEVFVSPTGSWTILQTSPAGVSCAMAVGEGWTRRTMPLKGTEG